MRIVAFAVGDVYCCFCCNISTWSTVSWVGVR